MSNEQEQGRNCIHGAYKGCARAFGGASAMKDDDYAWMIEHLRTVLAAAKPGGNPRWGNRGVRISAWYDDGVAVECDGAGYDDLAAFDAFLAAKGIRHA